MTGKWKTVYFKWELPTYQNKDTLIEYDVDFTNPGEERAKATTFTITRQTVLLKNGNATNRVRLFLNNQQNGALP